MANSAFKQRQKRNEAALNLLRILILAANVRANERTSSLAVAITHELALVPSLRALSLSLHE